MNQEIKQDSHFYIDNVPPEEAKNVLRILSIDVGLTPKEVADSLKDHYGFEMQKDKTYTPRRLFDLGVASQSRQNKKLEYRLNQTGKKLQSILNIDPDLATDILHYLHYTMYTGQLSDRKCFWSYRKCCEIIWAQKRTIAPSKLAAQIQTEMRENFPNLDYTAKQGTRFKTDAASSVYRWLRNLEPPPFTENGKGEIPVRPRNVERHELALLALDYIYRSRNYPYGDPVMMDDTFIQQVAGVFFLDPECCRNLIHIGARITPCIKLGDTLAGASIKLLKPFTIENL